ncbi:MAG: nucleotidyltransferase domain-containing protein [Chitinivibrionales bacterium]|nr:nucleotidyltransferase domain-containing protein [Chitinivibrionales bacterium]
MFGLTKDDIITIKNSIAKHNEIESALLFGSRAKGNFKHGSDVDIALKGKDIDYTVILSISTELNEETTLPYHFDVLNYRMLESTELIDHINRVGVEFYRKSE